MEIKRLKFLFLSLIMLSLPMKSIVASPEAMAQEAPGILVSIAQKVSSVYDAVAGGISSGYDGITKNIKFLTQYKQAILTTSALTTCIYAIKLIKEYSAYLVEADREFFQAVEREYNYKINHPKQSHSDEWTGHVAKAKCHYYFFKGMPVLLRKYTEALADVENNRANDIYLLKEEIKRTINSYRLNGFLWSLLIGSYVSPHSIETPFSQPLHA